MSQSQLASASGISRSMVSMIEIGHRKNPSLDLMKLLALSLRVPILLVVDAIESGPAA